MLHSFLFVLYWDCFLFIGIFWTSSSLCELYVEPVCLLMWLLSRASSCFVFVEPVQGIIFCSNSIVLLVTGVSMLQLNFGIWRWSSGPLHIINSSALWVAVLKRSSCSICLSCQSALRCSCLFQIIFINRRSSCSLGSISAATASSTSIEPARGNQGESNGTSTGKDGRLCIRSVNRDGCAHLKVVSTRRLDGLYRFNRLNWFDWCYWSYWSHRPHWLNRFDRLWFHNWLRRRRWRLVSLAILIVKQSDYATTISLPVSASAGLASGGSSAHREKTGTGGYQVIFDIIALITHRLASYSIIAT